MTAERHPNKPRPRPRRRNWGSLILVTVLLLAVVVAVGWAGRKPWTLARDEQLRATQLRKELAAVRARNAQLLQDRKRLETPGGVEGEARRQGWVKQGETIINLQDAPSGK